MTAASDDATGQGPGEAPDSVAGLRRLLAEQTAARLAAETALAERTAELRQSREYQAATSDVLKVISRSAFDLQPVLQTVAEAAGRLCEADMVVIMRGDGETFRLAANHGFPPEFEAWMRGRTYTPGHGTLIARVALEKCTLQMEDVTVEPGYAQPESMALGRIRTNLGVPLMREGVVIGMIMLARQRVERFTERQIELVRTFADQAVVAIENTRLITEQGEALERQTAVTDVLRIINNTPGILTPVFNAILEKAHRLCDAPLGSLQTLDGNLLRAVATRGIPRAMDDFLRAGFEPRPGFLTGGGRPVQTLDMVEYSSAHPENEAARVSVALGGYRTMISVPLHKDSILLGRIVAARPAVRPFDERQIALLEDFAAQAVIAIENARLITETREALERQTATSEVLEVINASPGNLDPVFQTMLDRAMQLCGAAFGEMHTYDGNRFQTVALHGVPETFAEHRRRYSLGSGAGSASRRMLDGEDVIHIPDLMAEEVYERGDPSRRAIVDLGGARSAVAVAMRKEGRLLGVMNIYRKETGSYSERQIAVLKNFAAQAVIAMENARLITETREALEQQTATAEVLGVINASPGNLGPVFEAILEKAHTLCGAVHGGLMTFDGEAFRLAAQRNLPPAWADYVRSRGPGSAPHRLVNRLMQGEGLFQVEDAMELAARFPDDPVLRAQVELGGIRTILFIPFRKDGALLGFMTAYRQEVSAFTARQIALLENFAAQAVIAMENARLITETREALEQQTATAEVLAVINSSPGNLVPVFESILEKGLRLADAAFGTLWVDEGDQMRAVASHGLPAALAEFHAENPVLPKPPMVRRMNAASRSVQVPDIREGEGYRSGNPVSRANADLGGARTILAVLLVRENAVVGTIQIFRQEVRPFTDKQVALLENFAAQAAIAMENARLITETREALEQQTATAEVLGVINASPGDLAPVFEALMQKAMRLCGAIMGELFTFDGENFIPAAILGAPAAHVVDREETINAHDPESVPMRLRAGERLVHITDLIETDVYRRGHSGRHSLVHRVGARALLAVSLRKDDTLLGFIQIMRRETMPFSVRQVALLENFAAQAVIAMENARLITETREALERQTATAEVLGVINSHPGDLAPVFDAILEKAHTVCGATCGALLTYDGALFQMTAERNLPPAWAIFVRDMVNKGVNPNHPLSRLVMGDPLFQIADMREVAARFPDEPAPRAMVELGGIRSILYLPLRKDGALLGAITAYRQEVRPFTAKEIALLENFGAQATIAMENARLLNEIRAARDEAETTLADLRRTQDRLVQTEKMASLGQLTAGIAHEIKNPLNFVNNFSDLSADLLDELNEAVAPGKIELPEDTRAEIDEITETLKGNLQKIAQHGRRADSIVKNMLLHSRTGASERRAADLNAIAEEALNLAYHGARAETPGFNITLERDFDPGVGQVDIYPQEIARVLVNLINNGFYAAHKRTQQDPGIEPTLRLSTQDLGDTVEIRVRDNGTGIPADVREKIFEPFFTTKPAGEGTGLGLSLSFDIVVKQHNGQLSVASEPGSYTEFTITLPRRP